MPFDRTSELPPISRYELDAMNVQIMEKKFVAYGALGVVAILVIAFLYRKQIASAVYLLAVYASSLGLRMVRRTQSNASSFADDVRSRADR